MRNTQIFIALIIVLIGSGMAQAATIEVCSTCGNTSLNDAMAFVINGDVINVTSDLRIENMNTVDNVRVEGNNHKITISLPLGNFGIKTLNSTVLNNISIDVVNAWAGAIQMESTGVTWNNIHIEANDSLGDSGKTFPDSAGIKAMRANNSKIVNFTTKNVYAPLWIRYTDNFTVDIYNISTTRNFLTEGDSLSGAYIDDSTNVSLYNHIGIQGYPNGIRIGALAGSTSINSKNITISGTGKIHGNVYGLRGEVDNFTIIDAILEDNTNDMGLWGLTTYTITNVTASRMALLPNGKSLNVSNYALDKININGTEYDVSVGYGLTVSALSGSPPYNLTLSYNKSRVTELNLDTASLRVLHVNAPNETLVPIATDTARGTLTVQTSSFSPFVIYGVRLPSTSGSSSGSSGSGSGGYYDPAWYNPDGTRKTTPTPIRTPTPTPTITPTATPEQTQVPIVVETMVNPPMSTPTPTPENTPVAQAPGFEAVFAIAGLLAVAYLSRKAK